jgi:hypothetical protein
LIKEKRMSSNNRVFFINGAITFNDPQFTKKLPHVQLFKRYNPRKIT